MGCIGASQKYLLVNNEISLTPIPDSTRKFPTETNNDTNKINLNSNSNTKYLSLIHI